MAPALAPFVRSLAGYDGLPTGAEAHRGLPSTSVVVVLALRQPLRVAWWDAPCAAGPFWAVASGLHDRPAAVGGGGRQHGVMLALTPAGSRALLGVPAAALAGEIVDLLLVAPHLAGLSERLSEAATWRGRLRLVEAVLLGALGRGPGRAVRAEVAAAMPRLTGSATVEDVARVVGWSRRHLSAGFRAELGLGPKQYQRIARFQASRRALTLAPTGLVRPSLADVAAATGYADQAHMTREWTALAGAPPAAWMRTELRPARAAPPSQTHPNVQDAGRPRSQG